MPVSSPVCNAPSIIHTKRSLPLNTLYYVSSHDPAALSPQQFLSKIRNHWSIENKNHYPRDRFFDEDRCMIRNHNAARILAACRQRVLSLKSSLGAESTPELCDDFVFNFCRV